MKIEVTGLANEAMGDSPAETLRERLGILLSWHGWVGQGADRMLNDLLHDE